MRNRFFAGSVWKHNTAQRVDMHRKTENYRRNFIKYFQHHPWNSDFKHFKMLEKFTEMTSSSSSFSASHFAAASNTTTTTTKFMTWSAKKIVTMKSRQLKVRQVLLLKKQKQTFFSSYRDNMRRVIASCEKQNVSNQLIDDFHVKPWNDVNELIDVHSRIYSSIYFERDQLEADQKIFPVSTTDECVSTLKHTRDKLTRWKYAFSASKHVIIFTHLTAIESFLNAVLETHKFSNGEGNSSVLYSLHSIAVINFCNALASYNSEKSDFRYSTERSFRGGVAHFARILQCPSWIVQCRNRLSHSSQFPPSLRSLQAAISFAIEWMDRFFWTKLLSDQCRMVDVDLRHPCNGSNNNDYNSPRYFSRSPEQTPPFSIHRNRFASDNNFN